MGKTAGFLEYGRKEGSVVPEEERIKDFDEFHGALPRKEQELQGARCMECGVPFCQAGVFIEGMMSGCPLHNLVPEINDLVYKGKWDLAYTRLSKTNVFPEFTGRVCPALCEKACTCGLHQEPVSTRENEKAVIEYAFANDLVSEEEPSARTGKKIAVIGSGPSGLAAAAALNRRGHSVTVYERSSMPGGLLRFGIPNMKLDKRMIDRRIRVMEKAGVRFKCGVSAGTDITADELLNEFDTVILCCGASKPRNIEAPGRDAKGVMYAVPFLSEVTASLIGSGYNAGKLIKEQAFSFGPVKGKKVIVIGGGDTGNDCTGTCIRLGAESVCQLEMMPAPPEVRAAGNPWPEWPKVLKTDYGQEEAIFVFGKDPRIYQTTVKEFIKDGNGNLKAVRTVRLRPDREKGGFAEVEGSETVMEADLVLIAAGFLGAEDELVKAFGVERTGRGAIKTGDGEYSTGVEGVFAAGDVHIGQSLVVRAIAEGLEAARAVDKSLMGYTNL